jgi:hypothetical protein
MAGRKIKGGFTPPTPDPEEVAAVDRATEKLKDLLPGCPNPRAVVEAVVSAWIVERVRLSVGRLLCGEIAYSLGDAHLRGSLEAALPDIAAALADLPADVPFFELSKEQVIDVLAVGFHAGKDTGALLDDEVPFP